MKNILKSKKMLAVSVVAVALFVGGCSKVKTPSYSVHSTTTTTVAINYNPDDHTPCTVKGVKGPLTGTSGLQVYQFCGPTTTTTEEPHNLRSTGFKYQP